MVQQQFQGKPLGGIVSTVVRPFDADDGIDEDLLRGEIRYLLAGESYQSIAQNGVGIRSTVAATVAERDDTLEKSLSARLEPRTRAAAGWGSVSPPGHDSRQPGRMAA